VNAAALRAALDLVAVVASVCAGSAALSRWTRTDPLDRALVAAVCAASILAGVPLVLAMIGLLSAVPYLVVMLAIGVAGAIVLFRGGRAPARVPAAWSGSGILSLATGTALAVLAFVPTLLGDAPGSSDTRGYHIGNLYAWFSTHTLWTLPFANPGFLTSTHPGNGELSTIATLFATHNDHLLYVANILFGAIAVIACTTIARELGGRPHQAALATLALTATPLAFGTQAHAMVTDVAALSGLVAGVAALLRARREPPDRAKWIAVAGFALGFSLGAKYTVIFLVPIVLVGALVTVRPRRDAAWLLPGLVLLAAPWYVRNWVTTGNPLFPQALSLGPLHFPAGAGPLLPLRTPILAHVVHGRWHVMVRWARLLWSFVGPAGALAVAGVIGAFLQRPHRRERLAIAGLAIAAGVVYTITPYTGAGRSGLSFLMGSNLRYLLPAMFLGVCLSAVAVPARLLLALTAVTFAFDLYQMAHYGYRDDLNLGGTRVVVSLIAVVVVCALIMTFGHRRLQPGPLAYGGLAVLAVVVLAAVIVQIDGRTTPTGLQRILAQQHADEVLVLGGTDLRSIIDANPRVRIVGLSGGGAAHELPVRSEAELTARTAATHADVLLVKRNAPGIPRGWRPPAPWTMVTRSVDGDGYVRMPAS